MPCLHSKEVGNRHRQKLTLLSVPGETHRLHRPRQCICCSTEDLWANYTEVVRGAKVAVPGTQRAGSFNCLGRAAMRVLSVGITEVSKASAALGERISYGLAMPMHRLRSEARAAGRLVAACFYLGPQGKMRRKCRTHLWPGPPSPAAGLSPGC